MYHGIALSFTVLYHGYDYAYDHCYYGCEDYHDGTFYDYDYFGVYLVWLCLVLSMLVINDYDYDYDPVHCEYYGDSLDDSIVSCGDGRP